MKCSFLSASSFRYGEVEHTANSISELSPPALTSQSAGAVVTSWLHSHKALTLTAFTLTRPANLPIRTRHFSDTTVLLSSTSTELSNPSIMSTNPQPEPPQTMAQELPKDFKMPDIVKTAEVRDLVYSL